jgi:hypothetical protein
MTKRKARDSVRMTRNYLRRVQFCCAPKHGNWLKGAECELSGFARQCLKGRGIGTLQFLQAENHAWPARTNARRRGDDWQFQFNDGSQNSNISTTKSRRDEAVSRPGNASRGS